MRILVTAAAAVMGFGLMSNPAMADDFIKIMKVKGRKAIVKLPNANFEKGDEVKIDSGGFSSGSQMNGRRMYRADFDATLGQQTVETVPDGGESSTTSATGLDATLTFGWNQKQYEYGPIVSLEYASASSDAATSTTTGFGVGGFFEYNFAMNQQGVEMVPYVGGQLLYNSSNSTTEPDGGEAVESSSSGLTFGIEGGVKYFPFKDHIAINAGVRFRNTGLTDQDSNQTNTTEIGGFAGVAAYF